MPTTDFIIELFCRVDDAMPDVPKHSQSNLWPSEIVTLGILVALKGTGNRAFYRWVARDLKKLFPHLPDRTRLVRLFMTHHAGTTRFWAQPTVLGVADSYGIELLHPLREGRSAKPIGKKGKSNHRGIVGGKVGFVINQWGLVTAGDSATANGHDSYFQPLLSHFEAEMIILTDTNFHSAQGDPSNIKICARGTWNVRMVVETVLSMLTQICHFKKVGHRVWDYFHARLAFTMAMFNVLVQWDGLLPDEAGYIHLSMARFSL